MPKPLAVDSERDAGKSKKREGLWKPKSELPPKRDRNYRLIDVGDDLAFWGTKFKKPQYYLCQPFRLTA
jgi:hypothetical protein